MQSLLKIISGERRGVVATILRGCLWAASKPYGAVIQLRNLAFKRKLRSIQQVSIPVVSIGNLTVGGTGKTPAVALVAKWFRDAEKRVCIISRGFQSDSSGSNDEAKELENRLPDVPHIQNPDRVAAAWVAIDELATQVIVLDDAFQHRRLHRDLDVVLLDALNPFGFGHLLPRGLLCEPLRGIKRADVVLVTRSDQVSEQVLADIRSQVQRFAPTAAWVEGVHCPTHLVNVSNARLPLEEISGKKVFLFCGIGNPRAFKKTVETLGCEIVGTENFPDHHDYTRYDIEQLCQSVANLTDVDLVLCTCKDHVKVMIDAIAEKPLWALAIEMKIVFGKDAFESRLQSVLDKIPTDSLWEESSSIDSP